MLPVYSSGIYVIIPFPRAPVFVLSLRMGIWEFPLFLHGVSTGSALFRSFCFFDIKHVCAHVPLQ